MTAIILAAGYATRLYPLTRDFPKPLLEVAGRSILDRIVDNARRVAGMNRLVVVTNARFASHFERWRDGRFGAGPVGRPGGDGAGSEERAATAHSAADAGPRVDIVNDGSTTNANRIGALADLHLAVEEALVDDEALVLAGDNLFDFELADFAAFFRDAGGDCITAHELSDVEQLRRTGVAELADDSRLLHFAEKPAEPRSTWAVPPFYAYTRRTLRERLPAYLRQGGEGDAPGSFLPWLIERAPVYAFRFEGSRYDIGNRESYERVSRLFAPSDYSH
ncbi:MAG: NTP transferase domain-containing protein [Spirochaetes bacterium]|nr:NTP transferase domain-containing protein [Spirochaetota bacterium]